MNMQTIIPLPHANRRAALAELFERFDRKDMENAIELLIALLDAHDGNSDIELNGDELDYDGDMVAPGAHVALAGIHEDDEDDDEDRCAAGDDDVSDWGRNARLRGRYRRTLADELAYENEDSEPEYDNEPDDACVHAPVPIFGVDQTAGRMGEFAAADSFMMKSIDVRR